MTYATPSQIAYLNRLARQAGTTPTQAADDYGFGLKGPGSLTKREASELIDHLIRQADPAYAERRAHLDEAGDRRKAEFEAQLAKYKAEREGR